MLSDYQKDLIVDLVKLGFEYGKSMDVDDLFEYDGFSESERVEVENYFNELVNYGPAGFYEEFPYLDWDEDFIREYSGEDFDPEYDIDEDTDPEESYYMDDDEYDDISEGEYYGYME